MSMKAKTGIDLCNNQLINAVLENKPASSAPANPVAGSFFWDTANNCLLIYDGVSWINYNPLDAYTFTSTIEGLLQIQKKKNSSTPPEIVNVKIMDPANFDPAGMAAQAYGDARLYADTLFNNLIGNAPAALDTIHELAAAVQANQNLINSLQSIANSHTKKVKISNPALTQSGGICTWNCAHGLSLGSNSAVLCDVYTSGGEKVLCDITISSATNVTIKIASTTNIASNSYYAVVVG